MRLAQLEGQPYPFFCLDRSLPTLPPPFLDINKSIAIFPPPGNLSGLQRRGGVLPLPEDPRYHFLSSGLRLTHPLQGYMMEHHRRVFHPVYWRGAQLAGAQASLQCAAVPWAQMPILAQGGHQEHYVIVSEPRD